MDLERMWTIYAAGLPLAVWLFVIVMALSSTLFAVRVLGRPAQLHHGE